MIVCTFIEIGHTVNTWKERLLSQLSELAQDVGQMDAKDWDERKIVKAIYVLRSDIATTLSEAVLDDYMALECSGLEKELICTNIMKERTSSNLLETFELVDLLSAVDVIGFVKIDEREFIVISKNFLHDRIRSRKPRIHFKVA